MKKWYTDYEEGSTFNAPSRDQIKESKYKEYNKKQRSIMKTVGENMASFGCILIVVMFVGYIWTDMKLQIFSERMLCDALASIVSFILIEDLMSHNGVRCGKLYDDYISVCKAYNALKDEVIALGVGKLDDFCEAQINREYEHYLRRKCKEFKIDYDEYVNELSKMSPYELRFSVRNKVTLYRIISLSKIEPIELTPDMLLMTDIGEHRQRGGIGISAQVYIKKKTRGAFNVIATIITCIFSASIAFMANEGASWGLVMYTLLKLALLTWRMYKGYNAGARAYNTIEVRHMQDKMLYLNLYKEFLKKERAGDGYVKETNQFEQPDTQGRRESESGSGVYNGSAEDLRASAPG